MIYIKEELRCWQWPWGSMWPDCSEAIGGEHKVTNMWSRGIPVQNGRNLVIVNEVIYCSPVSFFKKTLLQEQLRMAINRHVIRRRKMLSHLSIIKKAYVQGWEDDQHSWTHLLDFSSAQFSWRLLKWKHLCVWLQSLPLVSDMYYLPLGIPT